MTPQRSGDSLGRECEKWTPCFPPRDLAPKDRNGASDPFVRVRYNGRTQETSVRGLSGAGSPHQLGAQAGTVVSQKRFKKGRVTLGHSRSRLFCHQPLQPQLPLTPGLLAQDSRRGVQLHRPIAPPALFSPRKEPGWWAQPWGGPGVEAWFLSAVGCYLCAVWPWTSTSPTLGLHSPLEK